MLRRKAEGYDSSYQNLGENVRKELKGAAPGYTRTQMRTFAAILPSY